jgi:pimeloyl-ACP methyl ester carboxylesterase
MPPRILSRTRANVLAAIALAAAVAACSAPLRPDLARMYRVEAISPDVTPVILIPGLFGSKLRNRATGIEVWPGTWQRILFDEYHDLELAFDPVTLEVRRDDLEAFGIAERVLGQDYYGPIIEALVRFGGYVRATPGTPVKEGERRYYLFPYDWRLDNVEHAKGLEALIETVRSDYGNPDLRVDIVAHSMGGIIARYYLRYGTVDVLGGMPSLITLYGTRRVRKLILLGSPNFGAISALHAYLVGEPIGLKRMQPEVLATMPSGYQLFPHPIASWLIDASGGTLREDLFDPATWERYRWNIYDPAAVTRIRAERGPGADEYLSALRKYFADRLERARRLSWMLSTPEPATPIRYVLFGGDCTLTPARIAIEYEGEVPLTRLKPSDVRSGASAALELAMLEPGDGRVTKPSLLARETLDPTAPQHEESFLPIAYYFFLCEQHDQLTGNINFQDNLLNVLLTPNLPWEQATMPGMRGAPDSPPAAPLR